MKYARIERERRFLLAGLPPELDPDAYTRLRDRYLEGTHLRLRRVESPSGERLQVKLGQKLPDPQHPDDPRRRRMTTLYLPAGEAQALAGLPAACSTKRRYRLEEQGHTFVIDVYEAPPAASGTVLAEVECETDAALDAITVPPWAEREVTADPAFQGINLARGKSPCA